VSERWLRGHCVNRFGSTVTVQDPRGIRLHGYTQDECLRAGDECQFRIAQDPNSHLSVAVDIYRPLDTLA